MDRFQFLKACGLSLGAGLLMAKPVLPSDTKEPLPRFRPGADGQILVSLGEGKAWTRHTSFGPDFEVLAVRREREGVFADLKFQGVHHFRLSLDASGQNWKAL